MSALRVGLRVCV